jgi:glycosyltransferase involved in cell wall biosynthesis
MEGNGKTVCMISCMHSVFDDRIYWKECISIAKHGYKVYHVGVGEKKSEYISKEGIGIIEVCRKKFFNNPYIDKFYRVLTLKKNIYQDLFIAAKKTNADIYHTHDLQVNRIIKQLKKLEHKPKLIYDVHECYPDMTMSFFKKSNPLWIIFKLYSLYIKYWEIRKSKNYDFIIPAYPRIEKNFNKYLKDTPCEIIYNYTTLQPRDNSNIPKKYDVIYIGAINKLRGVFEIIKTASLLKTQGKQCKFLILGPFHNFQTEERAKSMVEKLGLNDSIEFHKPVNYQKVEEFLAQSKISLSIFHPIKVFFYAVQIKTFEYMANGLPIVCSNFGTVNHYVKESNSGIPVNPKSIEEIAQAISYLIDNPDVCKTLGENGIKAVKNSYNWTIMEEKLLRIYKELTN